MTTKSIEMLKKYKSSNDPELKAEIIKKWIPYVRWIAERFVVFLPQGLDKEDVLSQGVFGLIKAIDSFDISRGINFKTYAFYRIKGAILDELRTLSSKSRTAEKKFKRLELANSTLEQKLGRMPTEQELRKELKLSEDDFREFLMDAKGPQLLSIDKYLDGEHKIAIKSTIKDEKEGDILSLIQEKELKGKLLEAVNELPDRERLFITMYYYEDMTLKEIAYVMKLTESRMSQIHTQLILHLRNCFRKLV